MLYFLKKDFLLITHKKHTHNSGSFPPAGCQTKLTQISKQIDKIKDQIKLTQKTDELIKKIEQLKEGTGIENLTRLSQELTKDEHFGKEFCVLVINSQKLNRKIRYILNRMKKVVV